jgi:Domain of unknown function (DUF1707)
VTDGPGTSNPRDLRCSDVDRDRVAEALRQAAGDGRLTLSELEERLDAAFQARTYGELEPITADLPQGPYPVPGLSAPTTVSRPAQAGARLPAIGFERVMTVLGDEQRSGRWEVPARLDVTCLLGDVKLDFTEAIVRHREVVVQVTPGGPVYWVRGFVILGDVTVRPARKPRSLFGR